MKPRSLFAKKSCHKSLTSGFKLLTSMTQWPVGRVGKPSLPAAAAAAAAALGMAKEARAPGTPGMVKPKRERKRKIGALFNSQLLCTKQNKCAKQINASRKASDVDQPAAC